MRTFLAPSLGSTLALLALLAPAVAGAAAPPEPAKPAAATTTVTWLGHATFQIVTPKGTTLIVDPWIKNPMNPAGKDGKDALAAITRCDYILVTHGHFDHVADAVELGTRTKARLVAGFELGQNMARALGYPKDQMGFDTLGNMGGSLSLADGDVVVSFVPAVHSSGLDADAKGEQPLLYGGAPVGYVIAVKNGPTIYHTGDTAYYADMAQIAEHAPDLALVNIGGHFGMSPEKAAEAAHVVKAKLAVPMHFKTFPILTQSAEGFWKALDKHKIAHRELQPGGAIVFDGKKPRP